MSRVVLVPVGRGVAKIDWCDWERVCRRRWALRGIGRYQYVVSHEGRRMHREIMGAKRGEIVDHINGDTLDNRRCNLRIVTARENCNNRRVRRAGSSGYRGVALLSPSGVWRGYLKGSGPRTVYLGQFEREYDAALAVDLTARVRGVRCRTYNFAGPGEQSASGSTWQALQTLPRSENRLAAVYRAVLTHLPQELERMRAAMVRVGKWRFILNLGTRGLRCGYSGGFFLLGPGEVAGMYCITPVVRLKGFSRLRILTGLRKREQEALACLDRIAEDQDIRVVVHRARDKR